jgi:hypothetical protein
VDLGLGVFGRVDLLAGGEVVVRGGIGRGEASAGLVVAKVRGDVVRVVPRRLEHGREGRATDATRRRQRYGAPRQRSNAAGCNQSIHFRFVWDALEFGIRLVIMVR